MLKLLVVLFIIKLYARVVICELNKLYDKALYEKTNLPNTMDQVKQ